MNLKEYEIDSVNDLLEKLPRLYKGKSKWFRGHANENWTLEPALARKKQLKKESQLLKLFKQNAYQFLARVPKEEWEWLLIMQHYGVPTRLLDWTESPLVGLYFSLENFNRKKCDAALWCLCPQALNKTANISLDPPEDIPAFGENEELNAYLTTQVKSLPTPEPGKLPVAFIAPRQFERAYAQQGVFTIIHSVSKPIEEIGKKQHITKFLIPARFKKKIALQLNQLKINKLTVFPQLENVSKQVCEALHG